LNAKSSAGKCIKGTQGGKKKKGRTQRQKKKGQRKKEEREHPKNNAHPIELPKKHTGNVGKTLTKVQQEKRDGEYNSRLVTHGTRHPRGLRKRSMGPPTKIQKLTKTPVGRSVDLNKKARWFKMCRWGNQL